MATRKIKDAKDLNTGELIYFKGHAQATFMSDGRTVEEAVSGMSSGSGGSIDTSNLATKTELAQKQDKLISGTTIKTINNTSLLGSGNISISGGSGTITEVQANGTSVATSGVANIPAATTSKYGVTKLTSSTSSTSTTLAATASAVKSAYDLANKKQDILTSGTNIKTINGESILGSGNITISGGSGGSGEVFEVLPNDSQQYDLQPNHHYYIENPWTNGNFTFKLPTTEGATLRIMVRPKYSYVNTTISFITDSTGGDVFWANDIPPSFDGNSTIEMSFTGVTCGTSGINFAGIWTKFNIPYTDNIGGGGQ